MRKLAIVFLMALMPILSFAIDQNRSAQATTATNGRFEIIQSEVLRSNTFRLDKYTGDVCLMVIKDTWYEWEHVLRQGKSKDTTPESQVNYQLWFGGAQARDAFLINVNTGETWILVKDKNQKLLFQPLNF